MLTRLPEFVDPWRLADQRKSFSGNQDLRHFSRLAGALASCDGEALFELDFSRDERRRPRIRGWVRSTLTLECQRCLDEMAYPVDAQLDLVVIEVTEEAGQLPDGCEPVLVENDRLRLLDLVEDELLLAIPQVPRHAPGACSTAEAASDSAGSQGAADSGITDTPANPFAVLTGLKTKQQN